MSTNIVVDVALAALRQLNQAQVNANRQAKLLADRNAKLAGKAVEADAAAKAQQGQDLSGKLLYGIKPDRRRAPEQVATYLSGGSDPYWLLVPSDAGFNAIVRNTAPFAFESLQGTGASYRYMLYAPGEGPSGSNALYTSTTAIGGLPLNWEYRAELGALTGVSAEPNASAFTFELITKLPNTGGDTSTKPFSLMTASVARGAIAITANLSDYGTFIGDAYTPYCSITFQYGTFTGQVWNASNSNVGPGDIVSGSATAPDVWHHLAIVQTPGSASNLRNIAFYIDGTRYFNEVGVVVDTPGMPVWDPGLSTSDASVQSRYGKNSAIAGAIPFKPTKVHGIRFTPRALYSGTSFTPPTSITSLA
jgi:hypothetical protein